MSFVPLHGVIKTKGSCCFCLASKSRVCRTESFPVGSAQKSAGDHSRMSFGGKGMPEAVTSEGSLEKINERGTCVGLKMEIV